MPDYQGTVNAISSFANIFDEVRVRQLDTQWAHKISVIPPDAGDGIRNAWWRYNDVVRNGPLAQINAGGDITTRSAGEYNVGDPALAGCAYMHGDTLPVPGEDAWVGYTNRLEPSATTSDGVGVGVKHFDEGEGDPGATEAGVQPYAWFDSAVTGVSNRVVPGEHWNITPADDIDIDMFRNMSFVRFPHVYYNAGEARVVLGEKTETGLNLEIVHIFTVPDDPMWSQSDLFIQAANEGDATTQFLQAAHYKAGKTDTIKTQNGEGRGGGVGGAVSLTEDEWHPLISIQLRDGFENVNLKPLSLAVDISTSKFIQLTRNADLNSDADFGPPEDTDDSEYAAVVDNAATGFGAGGVGTREYFNFVGAADSGPGQDSNSFADEIGDIALATGDTITLMVKPLDSGPEFNGASLRWGANF